MRAPLISGVVQCWGANFDGQLGDGTLNDRITPGPPAALAGPARAVASGEAQVCALLVDGSIQCWSDGASGQMGNGTLTIKNPQPATVPLCAIAVGVACGTQYCCALLDSGAVRCWGTNGSGQLGDGTTTMRASPVDVLPLGGRAVAIAAAGDTTCALLESGAVECWGALFPVAPSSTPVLIGGLN